MGVGNGKGVGGEAGADSGVRGAMGVAEGGTYRVAGGGVEGEGGASVGTDAVSSSAPGSEAGRLSVPQARKDTAARRISSPNGGTASTAVIANDTNVHPMFGIVSRFPLQPRGIWSVPIHLVALRSVLLYQSQSEMCICRTVGIVPGISLECLGPLLRHRPAAPSHLILPVGQPGQKAADPLLCRCPGSQAQVAGGLLSRPAPDGLVSVEVRAVSRQIHQSQM